MKKGAFILVCVCITALAFWLLMSGPKYPVALIRVVDAAGKPIAGALVQPEGLRTKPGPYSGSWYAWRADRPGTPPNNPVKTDSTGLASIPYPKYVVERLETGTLTFEVSHPDYVLARPECVVNTAPPNGAPFRLWVDSIGQRIQHKALFAHPDPIVLQQGAALKISVWPYSPGPKDTPLYAQVTGGWENNSNFWSRPEPGTLFNKQLAAGSPDLRVIRFDTNGVAWFSDTVSVTTVAGQTNELEVALKRGITLRGKLDATVPRPVQKGYAIVHVWPRNLLPSTSPPEWHSWTEIREDGTFEIPSLPKGALEIIAFCNGFINTNGPGKYPTFRHPQKHAIGTNDIEITVGMEPTARLEVTVTDQSGKPVPGIDIDTWPNVHWGDWAATVFGMDRYNTADLLRTHEAPWKSGKDWSLPEFLHGKTDASGVAVLSNLPPTVNQVNVDDLRYQLPANTEPTGQKERSASVKLTVGVTNYISLRVEPVGASQIAHY